MNALPPVPSPSSPDEPFHRTVLVFSSCTVGVSEEDRGIGIVLNGGPEDTQVSPAVVCTEKMAVLLIKQLQHALQVLSQLPVAPVPYD